MAIEWTCPYLFEPPFVLETVHRGDLTQMSSEAQDVQAMYYDLYDEGLPGDVEFYLQLARAANGRVLELGCGTGRVLIALAQKGIEVVGVDLSPGMLAHAASKVRQLPDEVRRRVQLVRGDMRELAFDERFAAVLAPHRGFGFVLTEADQRRTLMSIRSLLADQGVFAFDLRDLRPGDRTRDGSLYLLRRVPIPERKQDLVIWHSASVDPMRQVITHRFLYEVFDESGLSIERRLSELPMRDSSRMEIQYLLEHCGFTIDGLYSTYDKRQYVPGWQQIWVARPRQDASS